MMENDKDWLEDVRRWYFNSSRPAPIPAEAARRAVGVEPTAIGYEAALPTLQAPAWQTPPNSGFGALR